MLKKKNYKPATAPIEEETAQDLIEQAVEAEVEEEAMGNEKDQENNGPRVIQVPLYLSQDQINNMIIENNLMLKELMSIANESNK